MVISKEKFINLSSSDIFNLVSYEMDNYYRFFRILGIGKNRYNDRIVSLIDMTRASYDGEEDYIDFLTKQLFNSLINSIKELNMNPRDYVIEVFGKEKNEIREGKALEFLKAFHEIFTRFFDESEEKNIVYELLPKNDIFSSSLKKIVTKNKKAFFSGNIPNNINIPYLINYIRYYCEYYNIELSQALEDESECDFVDSFRIYFNEIRKIKKLTESEQEKCFEDILNGSVEAKEKLINSYLRLVVSIARKYSGYKIPMMDLIQVGNMQLMKAVDMYDPNEGTKFITYATKMIRGAIQNEVRDNSRVVRRPSGIVDRVRIIDKTYNVLAQKLCRYPTVEELAEATGRSVKSIEYVYNAYQDESSFEELMELGDNFIPANTENEYTLSPVEATVIRRMTKEDIHEAFDLLNEKQIEALRLRFGIKDGREWTFEEIGEYLKISRQAAYDRCEKGINILRNSKKLKITDALENPRRVIIRKPSIEKRNIPKTRKLNDIKLEDLMDRVKCLFKKPIIREIIDEDLFEEERRIALILLTNYEKEHPSKMVNVIKSRNLTQEKILNTVLTCLSFYMEREYGIIDSDEAVLKSCVKKKLKVVSILNEMQKYELEAS